MMAFYKAAEKFGLECMQLTPAFDIDLFAEPDNEEYNIIGDEMENPFFQTPAGQHAENPARRTTDLVGRLRTACQE